MNKFTLGGYALGLMVAGFIYVVAKGIYDAPRFASGTYIVVNKGFFKGCGGKVKEYNPAFKSYAVRLVSPCGPEIVRITEEYLE